MLFDSRSVRARPLASLATDVPAGDVRSLGRELFAREWLPDDPRCHGGDGLGPVYNASSCLDCHNLGGPGGAGPNGRNVEVATGIGYVPSPDHPRTALDDLFARSGMPAIVETAPDPLDLMKLHPGFRDATSAVVHRFGVDPDYSRWRAEFCAQARPAPDPPSIALDGPDRRRMPGRSRSRGGHPAMPGKAIAVVDRQRQALESMPAEMRVALGKECAIQVGYDRAAVGLTERNPPPLFGTGLIDALGATELESVARQQPRGIRGRVNRLKDGRIGRFGWKAQVATLEDFVLTACANELGLEVPGHHQAASPLAPDEQARAPDLTQAECDALVAYVRGLPPPVSLAATEGESADIERGRALFQSIGCASCHVPDLGAIRGIYSDLLLHDMGDGSNASGSGYADESDVSGGPKSGEWRTPPLWGFRDSAPYLHDGRAADLEQAVGMHGGQGAASAARFRSLNPEQRSQVYAFLNSLVAPASASPPGTPRGRD
jgi:CxxC motif-containing protein (DUF1111 family)